MKSLLIFLLAISLVLGDTTCSSGQVYVKFTKVTGTWASEESWEIYNGATLLYTSPTLENSSTRVIETCLTASTNNQYTLKMLDSYGDSWTAGAYLQIEGPYGNRLLKHFFTASYEEDLTLSLYMPVTKNDASWKMTYGSVTGSWTDYSYGDSSWTTVTLGSVTTTGTGTQYFRKQFAGLSGMAAYEVSFNYRYGIIAYINGAEIVRDNMPEGTASGSTTASGSYSAVEYRAFVRPGVEVANSQSVLAVELHFLTSEGQSTVDFDTYLAIYASTVPDDSCYFFPYDVTLSATAGSNVAYMTDFSKTTYYSLTSSQLPATVTYSFTGPTPYLNGIRVWPYTNPTYAPATYSLQGANSATASTWTDVVTATGLIYTSSTFQSTFGYFYAGLYSHYRLEISSSSSGSSVYAYEVQPLVCSISVPTTIEFESSAYNFYVHYEEVLVKPKVGEFTGCTINPTPLDGLSFDSTTCALSGFVDTATSVVYTVQASINGQSYSGSFTLNINTCSGTVVTILRTYYTSATYEAFSITDSASNVVLQVTSNSGQISSQDWSSILCLTGTTYNIAVSSSSLNYWASTSFLYVNGMLAGDDDYETILRAKYDVNLGLPTTYTFNAQYAIKAFDTWSYKMGEVPSNWYSDDVSSWATGSAVNGFGSSTNQIQLYRNTFTVSSLTDVAGIVISLKYQYGVIIYLNGHEVFRKGFTGDLTTSTVASTSLTDSNFRQISLPIKTMSDETTSAVDYVTTGTNTIAIGLVSPGSGITTSTFDCAVRLMGVSSTSRVWDTSYAYQYISGYPSTLMNFYYSYSIYYSSCNTNYYYITFDDDRHEWISSVVFKLYYTQNTQQPRNVVIKAKNAEDSEWTTLKTVTGMTWSLAGQSNRIWLNNNVAYNMYRFENFETGDTSACYWKISQIDLRSDATNVEVPALSYDSSIEIYKDVEMGEVYPNSDYYTDFTVSPSLPTGIVIDPYTGTISGTASASSTQTYTVSAKKYNTAETVTAQFSLSVTVCTGGRSLITLVCRSDSSPTQSSYKVYQGKGTTGTVVSSVDRLSVASGLNYGDFCLNHAIYTIELKDTGTGWTNPGGYYLTVDVGEMKFEMGQVYSSTSPTSVTTMFSSYLPFQIEYDDWKVYKDVTDVASDWNTINFDDSTWTVTKAADLGTSEAVTVYLRRDITLDDASNYQVLNVRVKYTGGVVAYFNGRTVARFNLEDDYDTDTESIEVHSSSTFSQFHIVLPTVGVVTGKNVIAFEIHRPNGQSSSESIVFDATGVFGVNDCSIGVDSVINVSGSTGYTIGDLENFFDLTPVTYGYQSNSVGTYLEWTVENLEGTKFNSFALQTVYTRTSWGFSLYGRYEEALEDEPRAEEYTSIFAEVDLSTTVLARSAWSVPVGIAGFRQFKHEIDDTASSTVYISAYIFQYCKPSGTGYCEGVGDYPAVAEGEISPSTCERGYRGYSYRECSNGQLGEVKNDKCSYRVPARLTYWMNRITAVMDVQLSVDAPRYMNIITKFYLADNTFLPDGLTLDETTGAISGVPTTESALKTYTIYGENPSGVTSTTINLSVRKGECKADGNFPKTNVGEIAQYECALAGNYVGTQKRACILGAKDGEWQKIQGTCISVSIIVILVIVVIAIVVVVVFFLTRTTKKAKAVGGVKGKKNMKATKTAAKKTNEKKAAKAVKV